jgi:signal transduction histidine kinase
MDWAHFGILIVCLLSILGWARIVRSEFHEADWILFIISTVAEGWAIMGLMQLLLPFCAIFAVLMSLLVALVPISHAQSLKSSTQTTIAINFIILTVLFLLKHHSAEKTSRLYWIQTVKLTEDSRIKLSEMYGELKEVKRASDMMLGYVSHEIRNPLNGVTNLVEFISDGLRAISAQLSDPITIIAPANLREEVARLQIDCTQVTQCCSLMKGIVNNALDICKIEEGNLEIVNSQISCLDLLQMMESVMASQLSAKGIHFTASLGRDFHEHERIIVCDVIRVKQIILNLLNNALKYTNDGYVRLRLRLESHGDRMESKVRFVCEVEDTGRGIPPEHADSIFEPFKQIDRLVFEFFLSC